MLDDYLPFYFTPHSPMMYNIKTGWGDIRQRCNDEIVILVSSLKTLKDNGVTFLFTDRHAYLSAAQYYSKLEDLDQIDWPILQRRDFKSDPEDLDKKERYQAEALIYRYAAIDSILGIVCYNEAVASRVVREIKTQALRIGVAIKPGWYF